MSWKAKVAADCTQWWEDHRHEFTPLRRSREVAAPPSPSTERRSRSRSASTSVTRQSNRSATPRRDTRRSVTPTPRGRAGRGPLGNLEEETLQEVEEFEEHLRESFENYPEPTCQATMVSVNVMTVTIWNHRSHGHPGLTSLSLWRWHAASDAR